MSGDDWGLIIEDDIFFVNDFKKRVKDLINNLEEWDGIWLGGYEKKKGEYYKEGITRIVSQLGAFGYIVKKDFAEILIGKILGNENMAVDGVYAKYQHQYKCFRSVLIGHNPGVSTILNKYVDYKPLRQIDGNR